jgi:hypothetical protein
MSTTPDPTKEIKLTNSTTSPIVLMLPTTSAQAEEGDTLDYGQKLELLTAVEGGTSVPVGATKTFVLDQTYIDPDTGDTEPSILYDLLPCTAGWLLPAANIGVMQSFATPPSYPPQTVTAAMAAAFENAALFFQTISAYPSSSLATGYAQAMDQTQSSASSAANGSSDSADNAAQSITDTVNAYFKTTKGFQNVTLPAVVAVQSYYGTYPCAWAEYETKAVTYYLYSSNSTASTFVGTISLTPPSAGMNIALANAGYTCTFTPASNGSDLTTVNVNAAAAKNLTYTGGLFVDDVNSDVPQVGVKGTFQIKSMFTKNQSDTQIITVLTGTVSGATVIGFDQPQTTSASDFWDTLFHPKDAAGIWSSVMQIGGAFMMLVFFGQLLYGAYKGLRSLGAAKKPATSESVDSEYSKLSDRLDTLESTLSKKIGNPDVPKDLTDALAKINDKLDAIGTREKSISEQDALQKDASELEEEASVEEDMTVPELQTLSKEATAVQKDAQQLEKSTDSSVGADVAKVQSDLPGIDSGIGGIAKQVGADLGSSTNEQLKEQQTEVTEAETEVSEVDAGEVTGKSGDPAVTEDDIPFEGAP